MAPLMPNAETVTVAGTKLDRNSRKLTGVTGASITIESKKQAELLYLLMSHPGRHFNRWQICDHLYGLESAPEPDIIKVFIHSVRRHLRTVAANELFIETVRGKGYAIQIIPPF